MPIQKASKMALTIVFNVEGEVGSVMTGLDWK